MGKYAPPKTLDIDRHAAPPSLASAIDEAVTAAVPWDRLCGVGLYVIVDHDAETRRLHLWKAPRTEPEIVGLAKGVAELQREPLRDLKAFVGELGGEAIGAAAFYDCLRLRAHEHRQGMTHEDIQAHPNSQHMRCCAASTVTAIASATQRTHATGVDGTDEYCAAHGLSNCDEDFTMPAVMLAYGIDVITRVRETLDGLA